MIACVESAAAEKAVAPFDRTEQREHLRIADCNAAEIDQSGDRSDEIAQVIEIGRIGEAAAQHQAFARRLARANNAASSFPNSVPIEPPSG